MSKGVAITFIVLLSIIAIALTGGFIYLLNSNFDFTSFNFSFDTYSSNLIESKTFESANEIYIDSSAIDVFVEESSDNKFIVELYAEKEIDHSFNLEDKKLNIVVKETHNSFSFFGKGKKLVVKIPREYEDEFTIDSKVGDIHITTFENLKPTIKNTTGDIKITKVKDATIEVNTGDIKVDDVSILNIKQGTGDTKVQTVDFIDITASTGDVRISTVNNKFNITNTTGDIKIQNATLTEDSNISNKTGDIKIESLSGAYIEASNKVGDIKVNNNDRKLDLTCTIHTNTGDIRVNE